MTKLIVALRNFAKAPKSASNNVVDTEESHMVRPIHFFRKSDPSKINQTKSRNGTSCAHVFIYC
jgi:hypothetical protein